ncbi:CBN-FKB-6 protein [Aphelenchoides avenae]|nr:CBN-FKB-6 protein [Aphelenchus avenae]
MSSVDVTLKLAAEAKQRGIDLLKASKLREGVAEFTRSNVILLQQKGLILDENTEARALVVANNLNLSLAYLKMKNFDQCKLQCDEVLKYDAGNVKALYRKGEAALELGESRAALDLFEQVLLHDADNRAAQQHILRLKNSILPCLPDVVTQRLCQFLSPNGILSMRGTCKSLKTFVDTNAAKFLAATAHSKLLSVQKAPGNKGWKLERCPAGRSVKRSVAVPDESAVEFLMSTVRLNDKPDYDDYTRASLSLDGTALANKKIRSLSMSLKALEPHSMSIVGDLSRAKNAHLRELLSVHGKNVRRFLLESIWNLPSDLLDDETVAMLKPWNFEIRWDKAEFRNLTYRPRYDRITDAVFDRFFGCADECPFDPTLRLIFCPNITVQGFRCALLRDLEISLHRRDISYCSRTFMFRFCDDFYPDVYGVKEQLGDLGHVRVDVFDAINAIYYFGGTAEEPDFKITIGIENENLAELRNDSRYQRSAFAMALDLQKAGIKEINGVPFEVQLTSPGVPRSSAGHTP